MMSYTQRDKVELLKKEVPLLGDIIVRLEMENDGLKKEHDQCKFRFGEITEKAKELLNHLNEGDLTTQIRTLREENVALKAQLAQVIKTAQAGHALPFQPPK